jgi:hypothetical protein
MKLVAPFCVLCLSACASTSTPVRDLDARATSASLDRLAIENTSIDPSPPQQYVVPAPAQVPSPTPSWRTGQTVMQGFFGVSFYNQIEREGGGSPDVEGESSGIDQMPVFGGGGQWKLGGESLDYGLEALFSMEGRANAAAFAAGGGGATIAVDVDMFVIDMYGGPFINKFLGDKLRWYLAAGPMMQFANYDQHSNLFHDSGSGFGFGGYARTGFEVVLPSRTMIGLGVLWLDTKVDLSGNLGDLNMQGYQVLFTVSRGI